MRQQFIRSLATFVAVLPFAVVALTAVMVPEARQVPPTEAPSQMVQQPQPTAERQNWPPTLPRPAADRVDRADLAGSVGAVAGQSDVATQSRPLDENSGLQSRIEQYLSGQAGTYGVAVSNLTTGQTVLVNANRQFTAASTYKLLVMYRVYQLIANGRLALDAPITIAEPDLIESASGDVFALGQSVTVGQALTQMIVVSSNAAAHALVRTVGGWETVVAAAQEIGMPGTYLRGDDTFTTTPADMLTFFDALAGGRLVSQDLSNRMIDLLAVQSVNDRLPAGLPGGVTVAHKTGELPGVRNDVGIVFTPNGRYAICVFGEGNETEATAVIAGVSRLVWEAYGGGSGQ